MRSMDDLEPCEPVLWGTGLLGAAGGAYLGFQWFGIGAAILGGVVCGLLGTVVGLILALIINFLQSKEFLYLLGTIIFWAAVILLWKAR